MNKNVAFQPDWISSPGETIGDILKQWNMSEIEFARGIGKTREQVRNLLLGREALDEEIARTLESFIGGSAAFWATREGNYREGLRELELQAQEKEALNWLEDMPLRDMAKFGWLPDANTSPDKIAACLQFFGVRDVNAWRKEYKVVLESAAFRTSPTFESTLGPVAAWLRRGEIESAEIDCEPWDPIRFRQSLSDIRTLTREKNPIVFIPELQQRFAACGVTVVIVRAPSGCRASAATRFLAPRKALILLSFRYLSDDQFWFSVFHEAAHLILHENRLFLETPDMPSSKEEEEANQFAADTLVPPEHKAEMLTLPVNGRAVMRFARKLSISPGIIVGQLQHLRRFERRQLNNLKRRYIWGAK